MADARILDAAEWDAACAASDVYFTRAYHEVCASGEGGEPLCILGTHDGHTLLVPGLVRSAAPHFDANALDLQTCNGYGGPLLLSSSQPTESGLTHLWSAIRELASARGVAVAFFRLHPLLRNERWLPVDAETRLDRKTVYVDASSDSATARHRNMVRKAARVGAEVRWNAEEDWSDFPSLYAHAMERLNASAALRFSPAYFDALARSGIADLGAIRSRDRLEAAAILLRGPRWAHYHLASRGDTADNSFASAIVEACVQRTRALVLEGLHLGGGRTTATSDSLLKFKTSLGGQLLDYRVARVIFDHERFSALCEAARARRGRTSPWLLPYRDGEVER